MEKVFMDGVELLSQYEIMNHHTGWLIAFLITTVLIGTIGTAMLNEGVDSGIYFVFIAIGCTIALFVTLFNPKPTGEYQYKVTISDEVNFNEFNEQYEIVSQDGKIYTIVEKE